MVSFAAIQRHFQQFRHNRSAQWIALLCVLHLVPVWGFKFVPTQDGLSHVYNAYVLKEWNNPEFTKFREVYNLNLTFFPNWSNYAFFYLALHVFPPLIAEKVYVTICVLLYPLSFYYLLCAIDKRLRVFGLLGFLYAYNYLLHMGFYNFVLSVPLCLISIGYWWKHKDDFQINHAVVLNLLLLGTYFSHFSSFTLAVFAICFLMGICCLAQLRQWRESFARLLRLVGALSPIFFILVNTFLTNPETRAPEKWSETHSRASFTEYRTDRLWDYFLDVKSLVYFNDSYIMVSRVLLVFMGVCVVWTLTVRVRQKRIFESRDGFLFLACLLTFFFFILPWRHGSPAWINDRVHLFIFPVLLGWFFVPLHLWLRRGLVAAMLLMVIWHLGLTVRDYRLLDKDMREFTSGAHLIAPNSAVSILQTGTDWHYAPHHGPIKYLSPFFHDTAYYCIGNGSHYVANYEPKYNYFPLHYKDGNWKFTYVSGEIDYMLVWGAHAQHKEVGALAEDYEMIHETSNLKLFRRR